MRNILYYLFLTITMASCYVSQEECRIENKYTFTDSIPICKNAYIYHDEFYDCDFLQLDSILTNEEIKTCKWYIKMGKVDDLNSSPKLYTGKYKQQSEELKDYLYSCIEERLHKNYESTFWQSMLDEHKLLNPEEYE